MNLVKSLPLNNLLVGVVVPIAAAWISYYLAERAISKKENSRLYLPVVYLAIFINRTLLFRLLWVII